MPEWLFLEQATDASFTFSCSVDELPFDATLQRTFYLVDRR